MAEFPGATDCFVDEDRTWIDQNDHKAIVLHCTASANPNQTDIQLGNYFETNAARVSTHYGIDRTGAIAQYVLEKDGAAGNGILDAGYDPFWNQYSDNPNWHTLSVECENDVNNSLPLTNPQKQTLFKLVYYWVKKYNIPLSNIKGHFTLEPVNRHDCPGQAFPWIELFDYLKSGQQQEDQPMSTIDLSNPTVASHFVAAANGAWHCPSTNATIGGEILAAYQKFGGDALNGLTYWGLPLTPEIGGIPGKPGTVFQRYERVVVAFDPNHTIDSPPGAGRVYSMHIDSGIGQDPRVTDLQGQVAALRSQIAALQPNALAQENTTLKSKIIQAVKVLS